MTRARRLSRELESDVSEAAHTSRLAGVRESREQPRTQSPPRPADRVFVRPATQSRRPLARGCERLDRGDETPAVDEEQQRRRAPS
jgi:hypothetical protein